MENMNLKITDHARHISGNKHAQERFSDDDKVKLAKASKDFESLLTSMMLKSMTKTTDGMFGSENYGGDVLDSLFESEFSTYVTEAKGLGIAEVIYKKITGEDFDPRKIHPTREEIKSVKIPETHRKEFNRLIPGSNSIRRLGRYHDIISRAASQFGVEENVIKSIILTESAANRNAVSKAKAKGLMQLMDSTAKDMGVNDIFNPEENIIGGTKYFAQMLRQYKGDIRLALAAYNAGPANVEKFNGIPPFKETKSYIERVMGYLNYFNG